MKLGVHVSTAGGIDKAVDRAAEYGCNTFQIFVSNPRGWKATQISDQDIATFVQKYNDAKMVDAFSHAIYLINLATENPEMREKSIDSLLSGLNYTDKLGLNGLVTHIGSHGGTGIKIGIERVIDCINEIMASYQGNAWLLLENTAGAGNLVGDKIEKIGEIIKGCNSDQVGFCLDTAHAFESGLPIHTSEGLEETIALIDKHIGLDKLRAIHLNDSMTDFNSKRDRHENFGQGFIGEEALVRIITHPKLVDKPFAMETPEIKEGDGTTKLLNHIRSLAK